MMDQKYGREKFQLVILRLHILINQHTRLLLMLLLIPPPPPPTPQLLLVLLRIQQQLQPPPLHKIRTSAGRSPISEAKSATNFGVCDVAISMSLGTGLQGEGSKYSDANATKSKIEHIKQP